MSSMKFADEILKFTHHDGDASEFRTSELEEDTQAQSVWRSSQLNT